MQRILINISALQRGIAVSGSVILEAIPTAEGNWQQTGPEDWMWIMPNGDEFDEAPDMWPRLVVLKDSPYRQVLATIDGVTFETEGELIEAVRLIVGALPAREPNLSSGSDRDREMRRLAPQLYR